MTKTPEALITEIQQLSEKVNANHASGFTEHQKDALVLQANMEKLISELIMEGMPIKLINMSLFYFWFTLDAPLSGASPEHVEQSEPFSFMGEIVGVIKETTAQLPEPSLSDSLKELNEKMQTFKSFLPDLNELDNLSPEHLTEKTAHVNTSIHQLTTKHFNNGVHPEIIANALFNQWLRSSVLFGLSEQEWQKIDHYFVEVLDAVRKKLPRLFL